MDEFSNGNSPVTRAELAAHLGPLNTKVDGVAADVKILLAAHAASSALTQQRRFRASSVITAFPTLVAVLISTGTAVVLHFS